MLVWGHQEHQVLAPLLQYRADIVVQIFTTCIVTFPEHDVDMESHQAHLRNVIMFQYWKKASLSKEPWVMGDMLVK